jgi:hypothetical protein
MMAAQPADGIVGAEYCVIVLSTPLLRTSRAGAGDRGREDSLTRLRKLAKWQGHPWGTEVECRAQVTWVLENPRPLTRRYDLPSVADAWKEITRRLSES